MKLKLLSLLALPALGFALTAQANVDTSAGQASYQRHCQACHQADGSGMPGVFPPLADNPHVSEAAHVANTVIHGMSGPLTVNGVDYRGTMPPMAYLSDQEIANIVAYILAQWGEEDSALSPEDVAAQR